MWGMSKANLRRRASRAFVSRREEIIYILNGHGCVVIGHEVTLVKAGCAMLFPKGKIHILENLAGEEIKVGASLLRRPALQTTKCMRRSTSLSTNGGKRILRLAWRSARSLPKMQWALGPHQAGPKGRTTRWD